MCEFYYQIKNTTSNLITFKDTINSFVGALIGIILGSLLSQWQWNQKLKRDKKILKANISTVFNFNLDRIRQCIDYLENKNLIPNFLLDVNSVNHVLFKGRELFSTIEIFDKFNWQRYQLEHLNTKLSYYYFISTANTDIDLVRREYTSLVNHLKTIESEISEMLLTYDKSI